MKINLHEITIGEVTKNYVDNDEEGVLGYDLRLNIRPKYQREFVYNTEKRNAVIDSIRKGFPLNVMYWMKNEDGTFEVMDGQQRTISFCQYVQGDFSVDHLAFHNLTQSAKNQILDYKLMVYICEGTDDERLAWFRIINMQGMRLTEQELRNATYTGPWLTHAKSIFSKSMAPAYLLAKDYVNGSPIRQELLETALKWISKDKGPGDQIKDYMSRHQHDPNANELWTYFRNVIEWVRATFTTYRREMKGIGWGPLYDQYKDQLIDTKALEREINQLMMDDDVTNKRGIYTYVLTRSERALNLRSFTPNQKRSAYDRQKGVCPVCGKHFEIEEMEADHINPWHAGGKTDPANCQMLCKDDNRRKAGV
ncbi:MAG: DUF262 domain-containing protein [Chloroflexi bacterium]|nr:DUF262 domain-containing protein [Chloroflexota bacterium]